MIDHLPGSGKTSKREEEETKERGNVGVMSFVYTLFIPGKLKATFNFIKVKGGIPRAHEGTRNPKQRKTRKIKKSSA